MKVSATNGSIDGVDRLSLSTPDDVSTSFFITDCSVVIGDDNGATLPVVFVNATVEFDVFVLLIAEFLAPRNCDVSALISLSGFAFFTPKF